MSGRAVKTDRLPRMRQQGMELWRPDWCKIYAGHKDHLPDVDGQLIAVTRHTLELAASALRQRNAEDYYNNSGAAEREISHALKDRS